VTSLFQQSYCRALVLASLFIVLLFVVFRWHALTYNDCIMVDESTFLVDAIRANASGFTPWINYDNITSGPLNVLPVALLLKLGLPANHQTLHVYAVALMALSYLLVLVLVVRVSGLRSGIPIGVGGALVFALQQKPDFTHYSSGLMPAVLLTAGWFVALGRKLSDGFQISIPQLFGAFLLFACAPFAKSQAGPPALACCLGVAALFSAVEIQQRNFARLLSGAVVMLAAGLLPLALVVGSLWQQGGLPYFFESLGALRNYAGNSPVSRTLKDMIFLTINGDTRFLFSAAAASAAVAIVGARITRGKDACGFFDHRNLLLAAALVWLGAALFAAAMPETMAGIYEVFVYAPALMVLASLFNRLGSRQPSEPARTAFALVAATAFGAVSLTLAGPAFKRCLSGEVAALPTDAENRTAAALRQISSPDDKLFIWGWAPSIYVHAGLAPATRFAATHVSMYRFGRVYVDAMMQDIRRERPRFVVDTMQSGFAMNTLGTWIGFYRPENSLTRQSFYPELAAMGYQFSKSVPLADGSEALIYELVPTAEPAE